MNYDKESKRIDVFHTHIEITPYELGENPSLEKSLSTWIYATHCYNPLAYHLDDDILYIPRGINVELLQRQFNSTAIRRTTPDKYSHFKKVEMKSPPRNDLQIDALNFLSCEEDFRYVRKYSQQALILQTSVGKTYITVHAIVNYSIKAIIITHQEKIKEQWIQTFLDRTTIEKDRLLNIKGTTTIDKIMNDKIEADIYFVNHRTLLAYMKQHGGDGLRKFFKKIKVGIKVFDEVHLEFKNLLKIDFFSNTFKTFYLTANFSRSDVDERKLFQRCFASVVKFGEGTENSKHVRKHIDYVACLYRSNPNYDQLAFFNTAFGFSPINFSTYSLHDDINQTLRSKFLIIFDKALNMEGKILITVTKIEDIDYIKSVITDNYLDLDETIGTINSKNSKEENEESKKCDIIISTIKSCGTGVDIKGLRCIINLEPFSSPITTNQLSGRLREYARDKETYFFDLIDVSVPTCEKYYKSKLSYLKKKCNKIIALNM